MLHAALIASRLHPALLLAVLLGLPSETYAQQQRAELRDGAPATGQLQGATAEQLLFTAEAESHSLKGIRRIEFPRSSPTLNNRSPARVFHLRGGGWITGELIYLGDERIQIHALGKTMELPRRAVLAIDQLTGEQQRTFDDFQKTKLSPQRKTSGPVQLGQVAKETALQVSTGGEARYDLKTPLPAGQFRVAFLDSNPMSTNHTSGVQWEFRTGETIHKLTIGLASEGESFSLSQPAGWRLTVQPAKRQSGWQQLTLLFDETRFQIFVGSHLFAYGRPPDAALHSLWLFSQATPTKETGRPIAFDDLQITEQISAEELSPRFSLDPQSQLILERGDVLYGTITALDSERIQLRAAFGELTVPWQNVRRAIFGEEGFPAQATPLNPSPLGGWQVKVKLQRLLDHPTQPGDEFFAMLVAVHPDRLQMEHPWLGRIDVPLNRVDTIEPQFLGQWLVLTPETVHLGNQQRSGFWHKSPVGGSWRGEFQLEQVPAGAAFLHLKVADLEPAGKDAPPASRFLSELRQGFLGTEVILNGQSLGRLNDHISRRETLEPAQSIRLPLPVNALQQGKNTWQLQQTARSANPREFDDCQIGPVWLEIESR